jgi:hypothetical protein
MRRIAEYSDRSDQTTTKTEGPALRHTDPSRTSRPTCSGLTAGESASLHSCVDRTPQPCGKQATMRPTCDRFSYSENETPWASYERMKADIAAWAESPAEYERLIAALAEVAP